MSDSGAPHSDFVEDGASGDDGDGVTDTHVEVTPEEYNALVVAAELDAVDLVSLTGERRVAGEPSLTRFNMSAGFQLDEGLIRYAFTAQAMLTDEDGTDFGEVAATVIVAYRIGQVAPSEACVERFGDQSVSLVAHPFLRENLATTALRLGFPGVLLPLLKRTPAPRPDA